MLVANLKGYKGWTVAIIVQPYSFNHLYPKYYLIVLLFS